MTQKEVHNALVLNTTPEQKIEIVLTCAMNGVKVQDLEKCIATTVTGLSKAIRQQDIEYLNRIIL